MLWNALETQAATREWTPTFSPNALQKLLMKQQTCEMMGFFNVLFDQSWNNNNNTTNLNQSTYVSSMFSSMCIFTFDDQTTLTVQSQTLQNNSNTVSSCL